MVLASSPEISKRIRVVRCGTQVAYANEDLDASELQNDWMDGSPKPIHRYSPKLLVGA
jgi:hypothetical protein